MLQAKIAEIINNEMGYTNGWRIPDDEYERLCLKVAGLIIARATEQGVAADQKASRHEPGCKWPEGYCMCNVQPVPLFGG